MVRRKWKIAVVIFVILVIALISFRKPFLRATMPEVENVTLSEFALIGDSAFVKLSLTVRNKAVWHIDLIHVHLGIFDDSLEIMSYESDTLMTFKRNEVRREEVYCAIPFTQVVERIRQYQGKDTVRLRLIGELVFSTFLGESSTVVDRKIPVNVPIPPQMFIRRISYVGQQNGVHNLVIDLTLKNDNARVMNLQNVTYELRGGTSFVLSGQIDHIVIAALDSTVLQVPGAMTVGSRFGIISQIILDTDEMPYSFVMKGTIVSLTGVVEDDVPMSVSTTGQMELYNEDKRDRPKIIYRKKQR